MTNLDVTDVCLLVAICLFSTGHWVGAFACVLLMLVGIYLRRKP